MEFKRRFITLFEDEDFKVVCEEAQGVPFLHCYVDAFNKKVAKTMKVVWEEIQEAFYVNGHTEIFSYAEAPATFAKKFLKGEVIEVISHNGVEYEVLKWELK